MKLKVILFALILIGATLPLGAQNLVVTPAVTDLGEVKIKSRNQITLVCRNTGDKPLVIRNIEVDCKCTKPIWSRAPIAPGDSTMVSVGFVPTDGGAFFKTLRFEILPASKEKISVVLRGKVQ